MAKAEIYGALSKYASEILHRARVLPTRPAASLNEREIRLIFRKMREVLAAAIRACGTTFADFQDSRGEVGNFQEFLRVYGRSGKKCYRCRSGETASIERILQAGRSTFYCPQCQK